MRLVNADLVVDISKSDIERKVRLLTLAALTSNHVGKEVSYDTLAKALQVPDDDVEKWVIQGMSFPPWPCHPHPDATTAGIRAKLLVGKLNQPAKTLSVIRSANRSFSTQEWELVGERLAVWKATLQEVLQAVASAKKNVPASADKTSHVQSVAA